MDHPLDDGNWEIVAASPLAFHEFMHVPREITRAEMERVRDDYARAAVNADKAEFDMLEPMPAMVISCRGSFLRSAISALMPTVEL